MAGKPDWKPRKRVMDVAVLAMARRRSAPCRVCGQRTQSLHHLVPRSQSGDDVFENLAGLCGHGTIGCHGLIEARDPEACAKLRESLTEAEVAYIVEKKSEAWLDRRYPRRSAEEVQPTASAEISV